MLEYEVEISLIFFEKLNLGYCFALGYIFRCDATGTVHHSKCNNPWNLVFQTRATLTEFLFVPGWSTSHMLFNCNFQSAKVGRRDWPQTSYSFLFKPNQSRLYFIPVCSDKGVLESFLRFTIGCTAMSHAKPNKVKTEFMFD